MIGKGNRQVHARYGVDIRGPVVHAEVNELAELAAVVDGHAGTIHVVDRHTRALIFHGTLDDLRAAMRAEAGLFK